METLILQCCGHVLGPHNCEVACEVVLFAFQVFLLFSLLCMPCSFRLCNDNRNYLKLDVEGIEREEEGLIHLNNWILSSLPSCWPVPLGQCTDSRWMV